jgi:hypothetical protein
VGQVHKIRKTNFVDLRNDGRNFQKLTKIPPKDALKKFANSKIRDLAI